MITEKQKENFYKNITNDIMSEHSYTYIKGTLPWDTQEK